MSSHIRTRRVAVLGFRAVGKSSLVIQFCESHFVDSYYPTIENTFARQIRYKGYEFKIEILDTAGQDDYSILSPHHASSMHGYILVYSIASRHSFEMIKVVRDKLLVFMGLESIQCVVVGNKSDLDESQRQVTKEEGIALAREWNCPFVETSAKKDRNVSKVFDLLIGNIEKANTPPPEDKSACTLM